MKRSRTDAFEADVDADNILTNTKTGSPASVRVEKLNMNWEDLLRSSKFYMGTDIEAARPVPDGFDLGAHIVTENLKEDTTWWSSSYAIAE